MTVQVDVIVALAVVVAVVLTAVLVPVLLQLRRTLRSVDELVQGTRQDLLPILGELRETTARLNRVAEAAEQGVAKTAGLCNALGEVGATVHEVHGFFRRDLTRHLGSAVGLWFGIKAASKVLLKQQQDSERGD